MSQETFKARSLPPNRILRMGEKELELISQDAAAYEAFKAEEWEKVSDPVNGWRYFIENYGSHVPAGGGAREPLLLWPAQRDKLVPAIHEQDQLILLKTRRYGATLLVLHYFVWLAGYSAKGNNMRLVAISNRQDNSKKLLTNAKGIFRYIEEQAPWLAVPYGAASKDPQSGRPGVDQNKEFELAHRSSSIAAYPPNEAARSDTISLLFLDEFARYEGSASPDRVMQAALPTVEGGGRVIIVSSSGGRYGKGAPFARLWDGAIEAANSFHPLFIARGDRPGRDDAWFQAQVAALGEAMAKTEYPATPEEALQGDLSGVCFDPDGMIEVARIGQEVRELREAGKITAKDGQGEIGIDWGFSGTGWVVRWDLARWTIYIRRAGAIGESDAESASREIVETAEEDCQITRSLYDPGGSGAQANESFKRLYRGKIKTYKVSFSKNKRKNVEFLRTFVRRTLEQKDLPLQDKYGVLAIDPEDAKILIEQMKVAKLGRDGGLEKKGKDETIQDHTLDSLIAAVNLVRRGWESEHRSLDE